MRTDKKRGLYWVFGTVIAALFFLFTEGSLAVTAKLFGPVKATFIRIAFTIPLSWAVIFLATYSHTNFSFRQWFAKKEEMLSGKTRLLLNGGKFVAVLNTAVFLGPILASVLMLMFGLQGKRLYLYAALCALLCAAIWCSFYSGIFWGFEKALKRCA